MKILLIHNYYSLRGGEDAVFEQEAALLGKCYDLYTHTIKNKTGIIGAFQFFFSVWNIFEAKKLKQKIAAARPDIIHIHNLHFAFGPLIIRIANQMGVPIVYTLHNYRLLCPSGTLLHNGGVYINSLRSFFPWDAVFKKVYRESLFQTFWLAFVNWFHSRINTWGMVDRYIILTNSEFTLFKESSLGIAETKFVVKPNFAFADLGVNCKRGDHFLYVGRLSEEKGLLVLLDAFKNINVELRIAGTGPLIKEVLDSVKSHNNIKYLGSLSRSSIVSEMKQCSALIFPSIWYETFGLVIIEAFSVGTPVIASKIGSAAELIRNKNNGLHFTAGDFADLRDKIIIWQQMPSENKSKFRRASVESFNMCYSPETNLASLSDIYKSVLNAPV